MPGLAPPSSPLRRLSLLIAAWLLAGCASLPPLDGRQASQFDPDTADTRLGRAVRPSLAPHPGLSGVFLLERGRDAFATRVLLAESAERTLDLQYYIWRDDMSGRLLLQALRRAADRGVRVRLLLDDLGTGGLDPQLAALDAHPRIEVRLFNPFPQRRFKALGFLTEFGRLNRRMHNKAFTADNQVAVLGGRNVGDEYFGAEVDTLFTDLDVLAIGPVVPAVSADFDRYWNSASAYPIALLVPAGPAPALLADATTLPPATHAYLQAVASSPFVAQLLAGRLPLRFAPIEQVSDDPAKALGQAADSDLMWARVAALMHAPQREFQLVSPYFVPTARGTAALQALAGRGAEVLVLTNALEATDVGVVHAGYMRWRQPLLAAGVRLYETRRGASPDAMDSPHGLGSSAAESLHAKTFVVDRRYLYVGSFNFDPRSARLNTENGFVIDSPELAGRMAGELAAKARQRAYQLQLAPDGTLQWLDFGEDGAAATPRVWTHEPGTSLWRRLGVRLLSWLPIEWLL